MKNSPKEYLEGKDFSLVLGGPFFQFLNRVHLSGKGLELVKLRIIVLAMFAWLPLFLLSILKGQAWGEGTNLSFIEDFEVHIRFLLALPLMIVAELMVHQRMLSVIQQFQERNLIPITAADQFHKAISSALKLRNSIFAEVFILVLIYVIGYNVVWEQSMAVEKSAWFTTPAIGESNLSLAGIWFRYLSLPLFQFFFLRWYYRLFIWGRFLFQISKIKLNLKPTHPDSAGGLGFLSNSVFALMPLALVHGALLAGMISNHIFQEGANLLDFKIEIIVVVVLVLLIVLLPMLSFSSQLADVKRIGAIEYGKLAANYVQEFDERWVKGGNPSGESLNRTRDIQGLADLAHSYKVIEGMQILPIRRNDILMLAAVTLAPILPLLLTMMPLSELLKMLTGVLF